MNQRKWHENVEKIITWAERQIKFSGSLDCKVAIGVRVRLGLQSQAKLTNAEVFSVVAFRRHILVISQAGHFRCFNLEQYSTFYKNTSKKKSIQKRTKEKTL